MGERAGRRIEVCPEERQDAEQANTCPRTGQIWRLSAPIPMATRIIRTCTMQSPAAYDGCCSVCSSASAGAPALPPFTPFWSRLCCSSEDLLPSAPPAAALSAPPSAAVVFAALLAGGATAADAASALPVSPQAVFVASAPPPAADADGASMGWRLRLKRSVAPVWGSKGQQDKGKVQGGEVL